MTRAERRHRRQVHIDWRIRLYFTRAGYNWKKDNGWYREPGRLAKDNTACGCFGCRDWHPWPVDYDWFADGFADEAWRLRHRNRILRSPVPAFLKRGPGRPSRRPPSIDVYGTETVRELCAKLQAVGDLP